MGRLDGRQWGLVAVVAASPLVLAFLLAASAPGLVEPVLGSLTGGMSWLLAGLLGLLGGLLFAGGLGRLETAPGFRASRVRRAMGTTLALLAPLVLCIVPAVFLLLAGPAVAVRIQRGEEVATKASSRKPWELTERLKQGLPRSLPRLPLPRPW